MLVFLPQSLVFLAVPKAASTSVEVALGRYAETWLPRDKFPKHATAAIFFKRWKRFGRPPGGPPPDAFAIVRDPLDRMSSWYHYRQRPGIKNPENSTRDVSFTEFIEEYLSEAPKPFARVGNQHRFCSTDDGEMLVRYLFSYTNLSHLERFIADRFDIACDLPILNSSNSKRQDLPRKTLARFEEANARELELFAQVDAQGWKEFSTVEMP